jgi:hypothetical protein
MLWQLDALSVHAHGFIALGLALMAASGFVFANAAGTVAVQLSMLAGGGGTGLAGTGCQLLLQWSWGPVGAEYARTAAAAGSVVWTLGATIAPLLVALFWPDLRPSVGLISAVCTLVSVGTAVMRSPARPVDEVAVEEYDSVRMDEAPVDEPETGAENCADPVANAEAEPSPLRRLATLLTALGGILLFLSNATEHAVATWLAEYGVQRCDASPEDMARLTSAFFSAQLVVRVVWLLVAARVPSTWPVLILSSLTCMSGALVLSVAPFGGVLCDTWRLLIGALLLGSGVAVSFPAVMSLPAECGVTITARMITAISLLAFTGEFLGPWLMSRALAQSHESFGVLVGVTQAVALVVVLAGRRGVGAGAAGVRPS